MAAPAPATTTTGSRSCDVVDVAAGDHETSIYKPQLQIAEPRWSPDGKTIAFIEGLMSDEGSTGGDVFVIPAAGGAARNVTPGPQSLGHIDRLAPRRRHHIRRELAGESALGSASTGSGAIETVWHGAESITATTYRRVAGGDGTTSAVIRSAFRSAPEVWAGPIGAWKQLTHDNAPSRRRGARRDPSTGRATNSTSRAGCSPRANVDPAKKYPMIVWVHGGPSSARRWRAGPSTLRRRAVRHGYFVFFPNPRGSYGQGEAFTRANVKDFGYGDLRDIMAGVDEALQDRPDRHDRLGIGAGATAAT